MTTWEAVAGAEVDLRAYIDHLNAHGRPEGMFSATVIAGLLAERDEALGEATRLADQVEARDRLIAKGASEALEWAAREVHRKRLWGQDSPELADLDALFLQQAKETNG